MWNWLCHMPAIQNNKDKKDRLRQAALVSLHEFPAHQSLSMCVSKGVVLVSLKSPRHLAYPGNFQERAHT